MPASLRDKHGETFGSLSGLVLDPRTWRRNTDGTYSGTLYAQPDRGVTRNGAASKSSNERTSTAYCTFCPGLFSSCTR